ncbi:MAG TPA: GNAT family N-acetyltransferase, partial [Terriglobia bacterium]|nr:GNAT family N-acetyltransferase [Terriglobia bacterium]
MMNADNQDTIEVAREVDAVIALRRAWQPMVSDPNADIDFYLTVVQSRTEVLRPHVIVLKRSGAVRCILVGRIEKKALKVGLGYTKVTLPTARFLTLIHGGLLGDDSEENVLALAGSVMKSLREHEADLAWFYGMDSHSAFCRVAKNMGGFFTRDHFPEWIPHWTVQLPATYEGLYRRLSANTRHNLKRYSERLREAFGGQVTIRSFRDPSDIEWILSDTEAIASKTYHRALGVGFTLNDETRRLMNLAATHGWLRAHILYTAGKPCAFSSALARNYQGLLTKNDPRRDDENGCFALRQTPGRPFCRFPTVNHFR